MQRLRQRVPLVRHEVVLGIEHTDFVLHAIPLGLQPFDFGIGLAELLCHLACSITTMVFAAVGVRLGFEQGAGNEQLIAVVLAAGAVGPCCDGALGGFDSVNH